MICFQKLYQNLIEGLRNPTTNLGHGSLSPSRDVTPRLPEYAIGVLTRTALLDERRKKYEIARHFGTSGKQIKHVLGAEALRLGCLLPCHPVLLFSRSRSTLPPNNYFKEFVNFPLDGRGWQRGTVGSFNAIAHKPSGVKP
jgi:hypothetical protein